MSAGVPYVATVRERGRGLSLVLRIVCQHCGDEHEALIDPIAELTAINGGAGFDGAFPLALVAVWLATHTGEHHSLLRRSGDAPIRE